MRIRQVFVVFFLILLSFTSYVLWRQTAVVEARPASSGKSVFVSISPSLAQSAATPLATATPTTPSLSDNITSFVNSVSDPIVAFLKLIAVIAIIVLVILLAIRFLRLSLTRDLVIAPFNNASGNNDLDKVLPGFNPLTRDSFANVLEDVRSSITKYKTGLEPLSKFPPPVEDTNDQLSKMLDKLETISSGELQTAVQLLNLILTPHGTKIIITLQSRGGTPGILGMTAEVIDLQGKQRPALRTIWEPSSVSQDNKTIEERYLLLRRPLIRWLAIEVVKRSMEAHRKIIRRITWNEAKRKRYQARVYNFIGSFQQSSAQTYAKFPFFYDLAIEDFNQAMNYDEFWFQPYENLADTYVMMAQAQPGNQSNEYLYQALSNFEKALKFCRQESENGLIAQRIRLGEAIAQLMTRNEELVRKSIANVAMIEPEWGAEPTKAEKDSHFLYNLACWFGIAEIIQWGIQDAVLKARFYLLCSLALDRELWNAASGDPCFQKICTPAGLDNDLQKLKIAISQKLYEMPHLQAVGGTDFKTAIHDILQKAGWS